MRTTLTLDDDVLTAARAIADHERRSLGAVISDLARQSLRGQPEPQQYRNGIPLLPSRGRPGSVTLELVNKLRDELP
jgi:hypothetical protein